MSTKQFSISIPEPCSENWEEMTPCERGRFCGSCQKTVIDFTTWSDAALIDFFGRKENRNVCGHIYKHQIENVVFSCIAPVKKPYRTLAMAASVAALTAVSAPADAQKKTGKRVTTPPTHVTQYKPDTLKSVQSTTLKAEEIEKMPVRDYGDGYPTTSMEPIKSNPRIDTNLSGGRAENQLIIIDGNFCSNPRKMTLLQRMNITFMRIGFWFRRTF